MKNYLKPMSLSDNKHDELIIVMDVARFLYNDYVILYLNIR